MIRHQKLTNQPIYLTTIMGKTIHTFKLSTTFIHEHNTLTNQTALELIMISGPI